MEDPRLERDLVTGETARVAAPVHVLVVLEHEARDRRESPCVEDLRADGGVGLNEPKLVIVEGARLRQDAIGHRHLADVVQLAGEPQLREAIPLQAHRGADLYRERGDLRAVRERLAVLVPEQVEQALGHGPLLANVLIGLGAHRAVLAGVLRRIERGIGAFEEALAIGGVLRPRRKSDAHPQRYGEADARHCCAKPFGHRPRVLGGEARKEHGELLASHAEDRVPVAHVRQQRVRHQAERLVADRVATEVVDQLEVVDVDQRQREGALTSVSYSLL